MTYRVECLTPTLVGDGSALSPIDYMVWKDQVNVLNQRRIFTLLAKGPRLDNYLTQIKRAEKLDFATWGGFAQNYAERRIPFEDPAYAAYWQRIQAEGCHIPTFARTTAGAQLPASALRGALRTTLVASRASEATLTAVEALFQGDRLPRRPGEAADQHALGRSTHDPLKALSIADSAPVPASVFQVHMLRTATLVEARGGAGGAKYGLGWRAVPRGAVDSRRIEESTATFAEMAVAGTAFEGAWSERDFYSRPEVARALNWRHPWSRQRLFDAANDFAETLLTSHQEFAAITGITPLAATIDGLRSRLQQARDSGGACLLNIGWAAGLLAKSAFPKTTEEGARRLLGRTPYYSRAVKSAFPFPKTRRIVFQKNQPATLPGWVLLTVAG
jgi:CRISPR-associated protein Csm5